VCDAIKPQGGKSQAHILKALVMPVSRPIAYRIDPRHGRGRLADSGSRAERPSGDDDPRRRVRDQDAGCFMLEFEAVPARIAKVISAQLDIPTIGIGAGVGTDGQILLSYDLLGGVRGLQAKFTKRFANLAEVAVNGLRQYVAE